ncbi:MAG: hypothetical protein LUD82_09005, partial [Clostridiales bacterium]|nr:hypothetical protein [Clostridiales bacterium]
MKRVPFDKRILCRYNKWEASDASRFSVFMPAAELPLDGGGRNGNRLQPPSAAVSSVRSHIVSNGIDHLIEGQG